MMVIKNQTALAMYLRLFGSKIDITPEQKILDLGCADGKLLWMMYYRYSVPKQNLYGVDVSFNAVKKAKAIFPNIKMADIDNGISFGKKFDLIFALDIIEHLHNPAKFFAESYKALNKNGQLVLSTPNLNSISYFIQRRNWYAYKDKSHRQYFCLRSLAYLVNSNGLSIVRAKTISTTGNSLYNRLISRTPFGGQIVVLIKKQ